MDEMLKAVICAIPLVFLLGACVYSLDCAERRWRIGQWPGPLRRLLAGLDRPGSRIGLLLCVVGAILAAWGLAHLLLGPHSLSFGPPPNSWQPARPPRWHSPTEGPLLWGGCLMLAGVAWLAVARLLRHRHDPHVPRPPRRPA